ncbi:hypothetical protein Tola_2674 [Tolumonas auensis DSM 9187]|uniref:Uncharacterized protein n=1 Tax=Tolumonas auensis (strain DSM 9187 / NBRC 110442 / TA 4) TaxID=595494 RepID=C4LB65_TOLAT|nr:hypothetical protein Tola_2674 [Tolumonas auensis DSM 9187]
MANVKDRDLHQLSEIQPLMRNQDTKRLPNDSLIIGFSITVCF